MSTINTAAGRLVMAEETPIVEKEENSDIAPGAFGGQNAAGASDQQENLGILDSGELTEDQTEAADAQDISGGIEIEGEAEIMLEEQKEVVLPQKSVFVPASEFVPVLEREDTLFLNPHDGLYLLRFKNEEEMVYTILFNQGVKAEDLALYQFDSEKNQTVDSKPVQGVMDLSEDQKVLSLKAAASSDYVLVISHEENYKELGYTAKVVTAQPQETEAAVSWEEVPGAVVGAATEIETETESEPVTEAETATETEAITESESESATESITEAETEIATEAITETETESEIATESITEAETEIATETESITETESESETEAITETETESEPVTEAESETEVATETESESESETEAITEAETETESEPVTEVETETEAITETETEQEELLLASVRLELDPELETVPAVFSEYLKDVPVYSVTLVYSDGSEKLLDQEDERYELSVEYEDTGDADEMVRRTYHAVLKEDSTGKVFEDTQYIDFGKREPVEIKTEEMTTVILEGRKKWIMVQSVPSVTGRYAMNSDKSIEEIYYAADGGEVVCAEDILKLQQGISYQFLIKLS
ncbi:MAG: hypothetical protein Q4P26_05740 [Lachnospiraceae bacterium]|nr:hypothetical protein [Lachnospiraceae bacterium]